MPLRFTSAPPAWADSTPTTGAALGEGAGERGHDEPAAAHALRDGTVDVVGLARPLALEPDLARGILQGTTMARAARALRAGLDTGRRDDRGRVVWAQIAGWPTARLCPGREPAG